MPTYVYVNTPMGTENISTLQPVFQHVTQKLFEVLGGTAQVSRWTSTNGQAIVFEVASHVSEEAEKKLGEIDGVSMVSKAFEMKDRYRQ